MHESFWSYVQWFNLKEQEAQPNQYTALKQLGIFNFSTTHHCSRVGWNQYGDSYDLQGGRMDLVVENKWGWPESLCSWYDGH